MQGQILLYGGDAALLYGGDAAHEWCFNKLVPVNYVQAYKPLGPSHGYYNLLVAVGWLYVVMCGFVDPRVHAQRPVDAW